MKLNLEKKFAPMLRRLGYRIIDWKPAKVQANRDRRVKWVNRFFDKQWKIKNFVDTTVVGGLAKFNSVFKTKHLPSFPAGENPFNHDSYSMGEYFGSEKHICIMYDHSGEYFNIVHIPSGQRLQISLPKYQKEKDVVYVLRGVCPDCQQQGIKTIYEDGELVLQEHANQAGKHCVGSYGFPQATYEKKEKVNG